MNEKWSYIFTSFVLKLINFSLRSSWLESVFQLNLICMWFQCQVVKVFQLLKMLLDLVLFCCFLYIFLIKECFVLFKFVFHHKLGLYCFCCTLSRSCRNHSKFRRFKLNCFFVPFVLIVEMHHSILFFWKFALLLCFDSFSIYF